MLAVRPEFGPTLPELLAGHSKAWRYALIGGYVVILVVVLYLLLLRGDPTSTDVQRGGNVPFRLTHDAALKSTTPLGDERLRLQGTRGREVVVNALELPVYRGQSDGFLPLYAETLLPEMEKRFKDFELRREGRTSVNRIPGYDIYFQYTTDAGRTAYGRRILLLNSYSAGARDGVDMLLLEGRSSVVPNADAVGTAGSLKTLLRSFRFN